ncbi:MAG: pantoate--beta-alanine ligase [Acidimicrobiales bacterium]
MDSIEVLAKQLAVARATGAVIGLVPTMGALHRGHLALVAAARGECDTVVVSAFVNPAQFGPGEDLRAYPRDPEGDRARAEAAGADILFVPESAEMYPSAPLTAVAVADLGDRLEGASRPGHFVGVATVVVKLLNLVGPSRAYFGEKDYQQLLVVRRAVEDLSIPTRIVACPTVREPDGLALSSRNAHLAPAERAAASVVYRALNQGRAAVLSGERKAASVREAMAGTLRPESLIIILDYAEVATADGLSPAADPLSGELRLLIAVRVGAVRLIDNLGVTVP